MRGLLVFVFILGFVLGLVLSSTLSKDSAAAMTGKAVVECFVNNEPCNCTEKECICGDKTFDPGVCGKN